MKRIRIIHRLRVAVALLGFVAVLGGAGVLWWANHTGLPESWRSGIEDALAANGIHADVASLRYLPLRGIEAGEVTVYSDASRTREVGRLHQLILDVDRSRLSRGDFKIDQLDLAGARISLAVDPADPDSKTLDITDANGRIDFSGPREIEISGASGMVGGVRLEATGILKLYRPGLFGSPEDAEAARAERRKILLAIIDTLDSFRLKTTTPPRIRIDARGDFEIPGSLRATIAVQARELESRDLEIRHIDLQGEVHGRTLVVHHAEILTENGSLGGTLDYDMDRHAGRFELRSGIDIAAFLAGLDIPLPERMPTFEAPPQINAHGQFRRTEDQWDFQVIGDADLTGPSFLHLSADRIFSRFSWDGSRALLEDLSVRDGSHSLTGRAFITPERVLYQASTDLPLGFWQKSVKIQPLATILADFEAGDGATATIDFEGMANLLDHRDWRFKGTAAASSLSFRGVPARKARVSMDLDHDQLDFTDGEVDFDYSDYRLRKEHGGPDSGHATVGQILYDHTSGTIKIAGLRGNMWPAPAVRTFAGEIADELEVYGFHRPPDLAADGIIDIRRGNPKQDLRVTFSSTSSIDYEFLDETLELAAPSGSVRVLPDRVKIGNLDLGAFGGRIRADMESRLGTGAMAIEGELDWTELGLPEIAKSYDFDSTPKGSITGRIDFSLNGDDISGFDGSGHIALEDSELFDVPIFGPLSPVISAVLGRRDAGFQEATSAFCTFRVDRGVVSTTDFLTTTTSLVFTGDGKADLNDETLNMTVRMNARGFFGFITLPLRPFYGLFQFRGSGPIEDPEWKNVMFTSPPPEQESRLLEPPKARAVAPEPANPPRARIVSPQR
ncbi:hypothetical protein HAHE_12800 [Haloferula helveola]|uniref:AsmA-like C-terminal domain-containing protein n=1 Tax=Haloferula helveola TaxID=490095 RepID=A0ABN6H310_9BACT|nr:hypothetical protein HAHE_12800 [Haloferula helveola]